MGADESSKIGIGGFMLIQPRVLIRMLAIVTQIFPHRMRFTNCPQNAVQHQI